MKNTLYAQIFEFLKSHIAEHYIWTVCVWSGFEYKMTLLSKEVKL